MCAAPGLPSTKLRTIIQSEIYPLQQTLPIDKCLFLLSEYVLRVVGRGLEECVPVASPSPSEIELCLSAAGQEVLKAVEEALLEGEEDLHEKGRSFSRKKVIVT